MYTTIQNKHSPASTANGRYFQTFTPKSADELIRIHHLDGCIGTTRVTELQLEQGTAVTDFVYPKETQTPLAGLFNDLRNLRIELNNPNSTLRANIQANAQEAWMQYFDENTRSAINQSAGKIQANVEQLMNGALMKSDISITPTGITLGSGKVINGKVLSSLFQTNPESIEAITKLMHITGDLLVNGSITGDKIAANTITSGNLQASSIQSNHIAANAIEAKHVSIDSAFIQKLMASDLLVDQLTAKRAFINYLSSVKIEANQLKADFLHGYKGYIGGFQIGTHPRGWGNYITGTREYTVGMSDGGGYAAGQAALWVNWNTDWNTTPSTGVWYVSQGGHMYAYGGSDFKGRVDFASGFNAYGQVTMSQGFTVSGATTFNTAPAFPQGFTASSQIVATGGINTQNGDIFGYGDNPQGGSNAVVWWSQIGSGSVGYWIGQSSDRRLKENIHSSSLEALSLLNDVRLVEFDWKDSHQHERLGTIAQEVQEIIPEAVLSNEDSPYLRLKYDAFIPYLIKAIQELDDKLERRKS